jgi:hypothetical protein
MSEIEKALETLRESGYLVDHLFTVTDVSSLAEEYGYDDIDDDTFELIINKINEDFDIEKGINNNTILKAIQYIVES